MYFKKFLLILILIFLSSFVFSKTLKILLDTAPLDMDPRVGVDQSSQRLHQLIYNGLFKKTYDFRVERELVKDYRISPSGKEIIFEIKKGILFHDGKELSADDVVYTYRTILEGKVKTLKRGAFSRVLRVFKLSRYKIKFVLKERDSSLFYNLVLGIVEKGKPYSGTGPFILKKSEDNVIYLEGNKKYFEGAVGFNVKAIVVKDSMTRILKIKKGEVDLSVNMVEPLFVGNLYGVEGISVKRFNGNTMFYIGLNLKDRLLKKRKLRKALAYGINYRELNRFIFKGMARRAFTLLPPEHWAFRDVERKYFYSPERAKRIIEKLGLKGSRLEIKCASKPTSIKLSMALRKYWRSIGLRPTIRIMEFPTFYRDIIRGNFQVYPLAWVGIASPDIYYYTLSSKMIPPSGANRGRYRNPFVDKLLDKARTEYREDEQKKLYGKVQEIVAEDLPFIPLFFRDNIVVYKKEIVLPRVYPSGEFLFIKNIEFK